MRLEPIPRLNLARRTPASNNWIRLVLNSEPLPAKIDDRIAKTDLVLDKILQRIGCEVELPLGEEGVRHKLPMITARCGTASISVKAARLVELVILIPQPNSHIVILDLPSNAAKNALTLEIILGGAH